ncbi:MAG: mfd, partial [Chlamydiales bacterium]|nr:mfd [Chlamydiales bacterium]
MAEAAQADRAGQASLLLHEVEKSPWIQAYSQAAQAGHSFIFEELQDTAKAFLCLFAQKACAKNMLILTVKSSDSFQLLPNLATLKEDSLLEFPAWETLPGEEIKPSADIVGARCQTLRALSQDARPKIISASLQACLQKVIAPKALEKLYLDLKSGSQIRFEKLIEQLVAMDYERAAVAADKGQFAVRGGIIDIFPVSAKEPVRLDFFGDEIESIKIYDPVSQRSIAAIGQIAISPADESELLKRHPLATLLDYLGPDTLLVFDGLEVLEEGYARLKSLGANDRFFLSIEDFLKQAKPYQSLYFTEHLLDQLGTVTPLAKAPEN